MTDGDDVARCRCCSGSGALFNGAGDWGSGYAGNFWPCDRCGGTGDWPIVSTGAIRWGRRARAARRKRIAALAKLWRPYRRLVH